MHDTYHVGDRRARDIILSSESVQIIIMKVSGGVYLKIDAMFEVSLDLPMIFVVG